MLQAGSGFLSQHSKDVFFGLGQTKGPVNASIRWPSGLVQQLHDLPINHRIWVEEGSAPSRFEPFKKAQPSPASKPHTAELLPATVETWLLAPVPAPDPSLPARASRCWLAAGRSISKSKVVYPSRDDLAGIYNVLYRYLFDRHRDLTLPTSFLIDAKETSSRSIRGR